MSCYVYILECSDGTYYIGKTSNIEKRVRAHNGELAGGAKYTRGRRPVKLLYTEEVESVSFALKREYELKRLTKDEKKRLMMTTAIPRG